MAQFAYKAKDQRGRIKKGTVAAASKNDAKARLLKMGMRTMSLKTDKLDAGDGGQGSEGFISKYYFKDTNGKMVFELSDQLPSTKDLVVFSKQFSTMIESGVPLIQALGILASQQRIRAFGRKLEKIQSSVENGATLSDSLEAYPLIFDSLYVSMVRAGEASGNLDVIMLKLVTYIEKSAKIKSQVKGAMVYPILVMFVAIAVVTGLMIFVVPAFAAQYKGSDRPMPGLTMIVVNFSDFLVAKWPLMVGGIFGGGTLLFRYFFRTEDGRAKFDKYILKAPIFGDLTRKVAVGRFCSTLSTMLTSGVNLLEALSICAAAAGNKTIEEFIKRVRASIEQGSKFSQPLAEGGLFPPMVVSMVGVGEATGRVDDMLQKVSEFYEDEVDLAVKTMLSMIEPIMIVGLGGIIGFIVIAMYLPVFDMGNLAQ